ncbi:MAG TPA: serine/threonine protein kinase [Stellaceae bacterium]|nr:serine/threonine protein kinase [Stellaceae bacterium]
MNSISSNLVHGTAVALGRAGVLLRGPSGAGKSDLALRLIDQGAALVADDQTALARAGDEVVMSAPQAIAGMIEARGVGLLRLPRQASASLRLVVDLVPAEKIERLPERRSCDILGVPIPLIALAPFEASAAAKLRLALKVLAGDEMRAVEPSLARP